MVLQYFKSSRNKPTSSVAIVNYTCDLHLVPPMFKINALFHFFSFTHLFIFLVVDEVEPFKLALLLYRASLLGVQRA
jgi:hypothetical protein